MANYALCEGISFCAPGGRIIFLDLVRDQYLCVAPDANRAFRTLLEHNLPVSAGDVAALAELEAAGLIRRCHNAQPFLAATAIPATRSLAGDKLTADAGPTAWAFVRLMMARGRLRLTSLQSALADLASRKLATQFSADPSLDELRKVASAFAACSSWASPLDQCLPRSVAVALMMIDRNLRPELIIGVRLQPFSAHCWVQHRHILINETIDRVRCYTPILVV